MKSEKVKSLHFLPEFNDTVFKLLHLIKVDGYKTSFRTTPNNCEFLLINERKESEIYNLGDIYEIVNKYLFEENNRKDKTDYHKVFSLLQDIVDEFIEKIKDIKGNDNVFFVSQKVKYLVFLRTLISLILKVENVKKNIIISGDSIKVNDEIVYTMTQDVIYTTSLLRYIYVDFLKVMPKILN